MCIVHNWEGSTVLHYRYNEIEEPKIPWDELNYCAATRTRLLGSGMRHHGSQDLVKLAQCSHDGYILAQLRGRIAPGRSP